MKKLLVAGALLSMAVLTHAVQPVGSIVIKPGICILDEQYSLLRMLTTNFDCTQKSVFYVADDSFFDIVRLAEGDLGDYNIRRFYHPCVLGSIDQQIGDYNVVHAARLLCTLLSVNNQKIDMYVSQILVHNKNHPQGCRVDKLLTLHNSPIAILVDEHGYVVDILTDVRSEWEVLKAFGITQ